VHDALRITADAELAAARTDLDRSPWYAKWSGKRRLQVAEARIREYAKEDAREKARGKAQSSAN
jgi:membrane protein